MRECSECTNGIFSPLAQLLSRESSKIVWSCCCCCCVRVFVTRCWSLLACAQCAHSAPHIYPSDLHTYGNKPKKRSRWMCMRECVVCTRRIRKLNNIGKSCALSHDARLLCSSCHAECGERESVCVARVQRKCVHLLFTRCKIETGTESRCKTMQRAKESWFVVTGMTIAQWTSGDARSSDARQWNGLQTANPRRLPMSSKKLRLDARQTCASTECDTDSDAICEATSWEGDCMACFRFAFYSSIVLNNSPRLGARWMRSTRITSMSLFAHSVCSMWMHSHLVCLPHKM